MKKTLTILCLFTFFGGIAAQQISVKSFQKRETDLDARVYNPKKDFSKHACLNVKSFFY
ncbi:MAG: hypothetical protein WCK78_09195 [Paludibacter sp.]